MSVGLRTIFAIVLGVSVVGVGCGSGTSTPSAPSVVAPPTTTPPGSDANTIVITITSNNGARSFSPNPATIATGQRVIWFNADSDTHHILLNDGSIDSGVLAPGASSEPRSWVAPSAQYHCSLHPTMVGSVNDQTTDSPSDGGY